ncbi:MAG: PspC domain-containing protein [Methanosphaera stadtmanae]|nr:PspC domain-containing protein [Methanosphaera stadtmanae]
MEKKLYRSEYNRMIAGVCAGIAEYLDIDPTVIRLIWVLFTFFVGSGVLVYIIACLIIPNENEIKK